jgi:hypothetical protein
MIIVYRAELTDPATDELVLFEAASETELEAQLAAWAGEVPVDEPAILRAFMGGGCGGG